VKSPGSREVKAVEKERSTAERPLDGVRVLVTRAAEQADELASRIEALGGEAVIFPLIRIRPIQDTTELDRALDELDQFDWIVFTSVNTVTLFVQRLRQRNMIPEYISARVAAVGPKTKAVLEDHGMEVDLIPSEYHAEGLLKVLLPRLSPGMRVLFPKSRIARNVLPEQLARRGVHVTAVDLYETEPVREGASALAAMLAERTIQLITFTSSSTVHSFAELLAGYDLARLLQGVAVVSIGPLTTAACRKRGLPVAVEARSSSLDGLIQAMSEWNQLSRKGANADE